MPEQLTEKEKIRILFIIPSLGVGGAEWQLYYLLKGLNKREFDVSLAVLYSSGLLAQEFAEIPELKIYYLNKRSGPDFAYLPLLRDVFRQNRFDIVQGYNASARSVGLVMAWLYGVPKTVMTERNASSVYSSFGSRFYHFFERYAMRRAWRVVANSEAGRQFCLQQGLAPIRIRVIHNGIDRQRLQPQSSRRQLQLPEQATIIGMVARMFPQKDPFTFLHAARLVLQQTRDVHFVLLGGGPILEPVRALVASWRLIPSIDVVGHTSNVADYLAAMDIVALTSQQSEGCPNAVLEAMALAKPVIVTDVPGNRELVQHEQNGLIVPRKHPEALSAAMLTLIKDEAKRKKLGRAGSAMVNKEYDMQKMIQDFENLYREPA